MMRLDYEQALMQSMKNKELIIFDLDKTLAESKQPMDNEMAALVRKLLEKKKVAVISGGSFKQFQKQFVPQLTEGNLGNLFLFPTCGSAFYRYDSGDWKNVYTEVLAIEEKAKIFSAFGEMFEEYGFVIPEKVYGELIEDRETQITFAAYGSQAPLPLKESWDPDRSKRLAMMRILARLIPDFEIRTGGTTSIDITRKGIDKAYGIMQMQKHLGVPLKDMVFVGDDLGEGGNDHPIIATGVAVVPVADPQHTKQIIREAVDSRG